MARARRYLLPTAAVLVMAALIVLVIQVQSSGAVGTASAPPAAAPVAASAAPPVARAVEKAPSVWDEEDEAEAPEAADGPVQKLDPQSDAFFFRFDEVVPAKLTRAAAACYDNAPRVHRNKKMKLSFRTNIKDGKVTISDLKVVESTLGNRALEDCFFRTVAAQTWFDAELPDWTQEDELVLRPERGMKKYWKSNLEYEPSDPIRPAIMKPGQKKPWSDSATRPVDE